jgi:hypothetical protein
MKLANRMADHRESLLDRISESLFEPHTLQERVLYQNLMIVLAVVSILAITASFLLAPALR